MILVFSKSLVGYLYGVLWLFLGLVYKYPGVVDPRNDFIYHNQVVNEIYRSLHPINQQRQYPLGSMVWWWSFSLLRWLKNLKRHGSVLNDLYLLNVANNDRALWLYSVVI